MSDSSFVPSAATNGAVMDSVTADEPISVCSFSAAQGGSDKYRGALRLQSGLVDAGARKLHELGCAEMEVDEVDVGVSPQPQVERPDSIRIQRRQLEDAVVALVTNMTIESN